MNKNYTALLVEDDENWVRFFNETIAKNPKNIFNFQYAGDLKTSLELIKKNTFSLILLDLMLPDSQGQNTITSIMKQAQYTPVIILTTLADNKMQDFAMTEGIEDYFIKDEYDESTFYHVCVTAVKRTIAQMQRKVTVNIGELYKKFLGLLEELDLVVK